MLRSQFLCHVLKALFFIKVALKLDCFCKKMQNFLALGTPPPDPHSSPPHCEFMATRLDHTKDIFYTFVLGLHLTLGKKIGLNLSKDLFFCSSPTVTLGKKSDWIWVEQFLILIFVLLKFSEVPAPPFSKSCVRYCKHPIPKSLKICIFFFSLTIFVFFSCFVPFLSGFFSSLHPQQ